MKVGLFFVGRRDTVPDARPDGPPQGRGAGMLFYVRRPTGFRAR